MSQLPGFIIKLINSRCKKIFQGAKLKSTISRTIFTSFILSKKVSFKLSDIGEGIREVVVKEWFVSVGDKVSQFDNICEVQSDKASVTITSRYDGLITKLHYQVDDIALVGQPLIDLETEEKSDANEVSEQSTECAASVPAENERIQEMEETSAVDMKSSSSGSDWNENPGLCIPSVRRLAKEHRIALKNITGTGKQGRILKEDILKYMEQPEIDVPEQMSRNPSPTRPAFLQADTRTEPIKGFTKAMVKTMTEALRIPHFVYSDEIKVTTLSKLRNELKELPQLKVKLTFLPFIIKAASNALQRYPIINSSVDENCENIIYKRHHNIGIAMATSQGLAVPVIKGVDRLTILEVTEELDRLIQNGRSGTFSPSDLKGATFSISNIGIVGGTYTKPVILPPQVAIIAIGRTQVLPRFDDDGNIVKEEIIKVSGSADHRVIDGVTMGNFIKTLKKQIENPNLLFLNL